VNWRREINHETALQHEQVEQGKWKVRWETTRSGFQRYEVFTDPSGVEWVRARSREATELEVKLEGGKTRGLPPLLLKRRSRPFGVVVGSITPPAPPSVAPVTVDPIPAPLAPLPPGDV
jgi:hypothetical protein